LTGGKKTSKKKGNKNRKRSKKKKETDLRYTYKFDPPRLMSPSVYVKNKGVS